MLRTLRADPHYEPSVIPSNFLGGLTGGLRTLTLATVTLPPFCPALSTVTDLSVSGPLDMEQAVTFTRLFQLFPALESLTLDQLRQELSHHLPRAPAPVSLRKITLETFEGDYDLMEHYLEWRSRTLVDVEIEQIAPSPHSLRPLVDGALELMVGREYAFDRTFFRARGPGWTRGINFCSSGDAAAQSAAMILAVHSALLQVFRIELPSASLCAFLPVVAGLPRLRELTLHTRAGRHVPGSPAHYIGWEGLDLLPELPESIELVIVDIVGGAHACPLSAQDVRDLCSVLARLKHASLPRILVKGFTAEALNAVERSALDGCSVEFEIAVTT
ncbi:hypothetical protein AURDEDRAFT_171202 [Auricularia subglabra TFB-10046 SS5]|uniref:Uncharacterized protein n=1 Tax=Auricularia subglabra (strain TFB-10046 / SS5) TaxID=717982 RepID=J0LJ69_AURST|nr:hypothetical protein AURDEDRAFT_171202 [Auricularia subglabra TFB-10046 SS5]